MMVRIDDRHVGIDGFFAAAVEPIRPHRQMQADRGRGCWRLHRLPHGPRHRRYVRNILSKVRAVAQIIVGRWGKNLAVRVPSEIAKRSGLRDGERVEIDVQDGDLVIRRTVPRFSLRELFRGRRPEEWRALYRGTFDWGPDLGREAVEE
jgi:antitoxin MazE